MPNDILFAHPDWSLMPQTPKGCECGWSNGQGLVVGLRHIGFDKALRDRMADVKAVRAHYRTNFAREGMGLIECEVFEIEGVPAVRAIGKVILQPIHAIYAGTIALPLPRESYVLNVAAKEAGITGMRDTAVMLKASVELEKQGYALDLHSEGASGQPAKTAKAPVVWKQAVTGAVVRWAQDPYDSEWEGPCLRNLADAPEHDRAFPQHPLSRVRLALQCLTQGVRLSAELKQRAAGQRHWGLW